MQPEVDQYHDTAFDALTMISSTQNVYRWEQDIPLIPDRSPDYVAAPITLTQRAGMYTPLEYSNTKQST